MPTRLIREGINSSPRINALPFGPEILYRRTMSVVDDYGRFYASPGTIRGACWPICPDKVTDEQVGQWMEALVEGKRPLWSLYEVDGCRYLQINDFNQKVRSNSKFPSPEGEFCKQLDSNLLRNVRTSRKSESESESEAKSEKPFSSPAGAGDDQTDPPVELTLEPQETFAAKADASRNADARWFDEFWALYWRKVGKKAARKAFLKSVKTRADWDRVQMALIEQTAEMMAREPEMRPHAATWLNQGRMFDETSPPQVGRKQPINAHDRNQQRREETNLLAKILRNK